MGAADLRSGGAQPRIDALDPTTFVVAGLLMAAVGLAACLVPALRASRVDPIRALQYE